MINFSTEFPIDTKVTVEEVIRLACEWVRGSPHTTVPKNELDRLPINDELSYSTGTVTLPLDSVVLTRSIMRLSSTVPRSSYSRTASG